MKEQEIETRVPAYPIISIEKARKIYYKEHNIGFFKRFSESTLLIHDNAIISIGGKGYWLSDIIFENITKKFDYLQEVLIKDSELVWTHINGELASVFKTKKTLKEIRSKLKLPEYE